MGRAYSLAGAAPSLQDLTGALTYVEEDHKPGAEEVRLDSHNENRSLEIHFSATEGVSSNQAARL